MPTTSLTFPGPPGPPPFPELTLSNQEAFATERLVLESALRDVVQTEAEIDRVLQVVQARKQEYAERAALLRLALAPCRILPQEIWSRIFCVVMDLVDTNQTPPYRIRGSSTGRVPSWARAVGQRAGIPIVQARQLSLVCRMWRRAVLAAPYLWRYLPSEMAPGYVPGTLGEEEEFTWRTRYNYALQTHLSYAGSLPLKMCAILPTRGLDLPVNAEYFQLLTKALPRLSYLNVFVHGKSALDHFSTLPQNFGKLKTLVFSVLFEDNSNQIRTQPDRPLTLFDHCPLLSEMDLTWMFGSNDTRIPLTDWAHMPSWSNLTRIKASNVHAVDIFRILKISTKLIDATFNISSRSGDDGQSSSEDEIVTCPVLRMLDMDLRRPQQPPSFTDRLQLPALTHLVVSLPRSTRFRLALPVRPPCLGSLTHLVFTHIGVLWDTQQWVDLLTSTPSVTHLKMAFFIGVGRLVSRLSDTTLLAGLRMLMIDGVTEDPEFYDPDSDASDEDARALGLHLSAFTTARFGPYPLPGSVSSNGMAGLKIIFADEEYASRMYASACYSWNGWSTGSPLNCPVYARLEDTLAHTVCTLGQLDGLERDSLDAVIIREVLLEEIPEIVDASKGCKGHHLTEPIDEEMGAVEILAWLRGCFPNENVCEDLWSSWQELKAEYMNGPGWVCAEIELETGWQVFRALEFVPSGAYRVRNSLRKQKMIQTYPDLKSDIWWSTDIPLGQFKD